MSIVSVIESLTGRDRVGKAGVFMVGVALLVSACVTPAPPPAPDVATVTVGAGNGFGGGTIYYPQGATGRLPVVAASPGFTENQNAVGWYGPLLAREGNIVITIDTNSPFDSPTSRADQLLAAIDYVVNRSSVASIADGSRTAVMGHSMGGGGSLEAALKRPGLKAIIPLAPWNTTTNFSGVRVPTLIVGCQNDAIAPVGSHAEPFYQSIPATTPKAYLEIAGGDHFCTNSENPTIANYVVAWTDRFLQGDTSASSRLCPPPPAGGSISEYRANCPY
ncbi:MAG: hypothetical protein KatS3mg008_2142 [Acidimicrobiales bacterium]|nr:MAG: hypothetical protein KatS3mg008_2142 [Acidimicrobiales bacterium]